MKLNVEKRKIPVSWGKMKILLLRPEKGDARRPGILWIHGGGYSTGRSEMVFASAGREIAEKFGCTVLSPEYRRSGKSPYPAALDDCYAALEYLYDNADELLVDRNCLIVGGESAGGGLCAAVCMLAKDRGKIPVALQIPLYPMLDCDDTESSRDNHGHVWNTRRNHRAWKKYLGPLFGSPTVPEYASPAKRKNYEGLPRAFTYVCDGEPFFCETLDYVDRLNAAGVPSEVRVYHGKTHGFDVAYPLGEQAQDAKKQLLSWTGRELERLGFTEVTDDA
ncbi:MAG: alpha/beta hydrolase [Clostridia bacterium]|nr:alpha/beta hydrolase [Clostridia bacterium]